MAYSLRPGISFCETSDRLVFLDLPRDRYFCLDQAAEDRFRTMVLSGSADGEDSVIGALVRQGLLERVDRPQTPMSPAHLPEAHASLLDTSQTAKPTWRDVMEAAAAVLTARLSLRRHGMAGTLQPLQARTVQTAPDDGVSRDIHRIAAAFARVDLFLSPLDRCLPRSIALATVLARRRLPARLVVGVRLRPFLAHSWVQTQTLVVNDRPDVVRTFVPILVV